MAFNFFKKRKKEKPEHQDAVLFMMHNFCMNVLPNSYFLRKAPKRVPYYREVMTKADKRWTGKEAVEFVLKRNES